jgi:hypothetical protein
MNTGTGIWMVRPDDATFARLMDMTLRTGMPAFQCDIGFQVGVNRYCAFHANRSAAGCNPWMAPLAKTYNCNDRTMAACLTAGPHGLVHVVHWSGWPKPDDDALWDAQRRMPRRHINYMEVPRFPAHDIHGPMHALPGRGGCNVHAQQGPCRAYARETNTYITVGRRESVHSDRIAQKDWVNGCVTHARGDACVHAYSRISHL